jgi:hypothetical protein
MVGHRVSIATPMQRRTAAIAAVAAALSASLASCGDSGDDAPTLAVTTLTTPPPQYSPLGRSEVGEVRGLQRQVQRYCLRVSRALGHSGEPPSPAELRTVLGGVERVAQLARRDPYGVLPNGVVVRVTLGDIAEDLEGANCSPEIRARIDEELATIPDR